MSYPQAPASDHNKGLSAVYSTTAPPVLRDASSGSSTYLDRPSLITTGSSSSGGGSNLNGNNINASAGPSSSQQQRPAIGSRGQPLTAPVKRGSACLRCRKHKLKCDAVKPHCSACVKHHSLQLNADPDGSAAAAGPDCTWDPEKPPKRSLAAKRQRVGDDTVSNAAPGLSSSAKTNSHKTKRRATAAASEDPSAGESSDSTVSNAAPGLSSSAKTNSHKTKRRATAAASEDPSAGESSDSADGGRGRPARSRATQSDNGVDSDHVRALEQKVRHMEALLGSLGARPLADIASSVAGLSRPSSRPDAPPYVPGPASQAFPQSFSARGPIPSVSKVSKVAAAAGTGGLYDQTGPPVFTPSGFFDLPTPLNETLSGGHTQPAEAGNAQPASSPALHSFGPSTDMLPSSYPSRLPPPRLLLSLVECFFARVPTGVSGLIHQPTFMRDLQRGPDDRLFPHIAILHAICALTARYSGLTSAHEPPASASFAPPPPSKSAPDANSSRANRRGLADPLDRESFGARHAIWAKEEVENGINCAERLFEVTIAHVILSHFDFLHARWIQIWQSSAGALRNCVPLGISDAADSVTVAGCKPGLLLAAEDAIERESRRRVFWAAFMCDRLASISSGWPHSLEEADVTAELPTSVVEFARGTMMKENTQTLRSPNLFSSHYPETTDGYVLSLKGVILLARVKHFNRRALKESGLATFGQDNVAHDRLKASAPWRLVQSQVELFRTSLPKVSQEGIGIDPYLIFAHALVYTAAITLHEHHVNLMAFGDPSSAYVLAAARAQLSLLFTIFSTNFDVMRLPPFLVFTWYVAGRTLARFLQAAMFVKDDFAIKTLNSELAMFRSALYNLAETIPVAQRQAALLDQAIQEALGSEPMLVPMICPVATLHKEPETKRVATRTSEAHLTAATVSESASPAPSSTGRSFGDFNQASSPMAYGQSVRPTSGAGISVELGSSSSSGGGPPSGAPTASPYSNPASAFSSASSPEDYLPRPTYDPPPLETPQEARKRDYASLPFLEGVDEGLIHSLFGPGAFGTFDDAGSGGFAGGATNTSGNDFTFTQDDGSLSAYPALW